ncbi:MAG: hypothetical protein QW201_02910 [Thermoproteota archaeon]
MHVPSIKISDVRFKLGEDVRVIELSVEVRGGFVELKQFFINNLSVYKWNSDKRIVKEGEKAHCLLEFPWKIGKEHSIRLVTVDDQVVEVTEKAPEIEPSLTIDVKNIAGSSTQGFLKINMTCKVEGIGIDELQIIMFTYCSFERSNRPVYIFYDPNYLAEEGLRRANAIIKYFRSFNVTVEPLDYTELEAISKDMPQAILILVNPLKDRYGRRLVNSAPASLLDPNGNGYIGDDSLYGRSHLFDWMYDKGLVLVTVGSHQPHKRILYDDGLYRLAKDSLEAFDAHLFLTPSSNNGGIIRGSFTLGRYSPTRISGSLGLSYREEAFAFDRDSLEKNGLDYYAYGDYTLSTRSGSLNLSLPVFIKVGRGGWLAMGDENYWLSDEQFSHDLFQIYLQSVWDSKWIPYGWYWDSGSEFKRGAGIIRVERMVESELIPLKIVGERITLRVLGVAISTDLNIGVVVERIVEYKVP